jgi:hypothetical protein
MKWRGENAWWKRNELNAQLARVIVILCLIILVTFIFRWMSQ